MSLALLDTNVLVHAGYRGSPLHAAAAELVDRGLHESRRFCIAPQNLVEFAAVVTRSRLVELARGQERYNVYCTPCHSRVGNGNGMIVQRGYKPAGNFHDERRLKQPLSQPSRIAQT